MFYLTLPSNSSQNLFKENTLSHYITQLPQPVDLEGHWEVGLAEIQYSHTWYNIDQNDGWIHVKTHADKEVFTTQLTAGQHDTADQLIAGMNKMVQTVPDCTHFLFSYDEITERATIKVAEGAFNLIID